MNNRWDTLKNPLKLGYVFSILAAVLLAMTPMLQTIHFLSCPHYDKLGCGNKHNKTSESIASFILFLGSAEAGSLCDHSDIPDQCPICQVLSTIGKHLILPGKLTCSLQTAVLETPFLQHHSHLLPLLKSPIRPRAPPLA